MDLFYFNGVLLLHTRSGKINSPYIQACLSRSKFQTTSILEKFEANIWHQRIQGYSLSWGELFQYTSTGDSANTRSTINLCQEKTHSCNWTIHLKDKVLINMHMLLFDIHQVYKTHGYRVSRRINPVVALFTYI